MRIIFWIFMGCAITSNAFGEDPMQQRLDAFYVEYEAIIANPAIPKYIELDRKLRAFFSEDVWEFSPKLEWKDRFKYANERTRTFGIIPGKFYMALEYTEILLVKAHEMDPRSKYREYTLFSQIMGIRPEGGLGEMPNIKVAYQYAKEFPKGPFISNVYLIIASFHKDLFMIVRGLSEGKRDYMYDYCFKPYVERHPYKEQMVQNKRIALRYYAKFKKELDAGAKRPRWFKDSIIDELKAGTVEAWSFCAD